MNSVFKNATKEELAIELEQLLKMPMLASYEPHVTKILKIKRLHRVSHKAIKSKQNSDYKLFVKVNNELVSDETIEGQIL